MSFAVDPFNYTFSGSAKNPFSNNEMIIYKLIIYSKK